MITKENFEDLLIALNFEKKGDIFSKYFPENLDANLKANFKTQVLIYPEDKGLKINSYEITSFSKPEFFVQFECIHRLFEKGYKPEHIELEPKWKVGHGASGGEADILVKDNSGKSLLIIECKTEGAEFKKEWNNTLQRGGQMLTYAKQAGSTQYVCLYASDFSYGKLTYNSNIISLNDNVKLLEELSDKKPLSYKEAKALEVEDIYKAWKETYSLGYATKGIFEDDIQAYQIGKQKYTVEDLAEVASKDIQSKYHEFATIMRQHNVSGRENAFDKLVNLFLCKIVDEAKNPKDLKFYWKGIAYDSFFDLQDRLQLLYQAGMKEFLGEDVTYIDNTAIDKAFRFFKKDPDATRETIKKYFRQLKFFTNNDFAFIDVHNEKLFYQNSEVLLKIVQMLQDTRLQSENQNQFLGDMFEGFLDNGVKQSEGQFFTPMPIVKFILNSLPLESIIQESDLPPKAIDYACGAGHFLNELALQIKPFVKKHKEADIKEYYKEIVGIEKEYRLSKVAKVSAFMYGQDEIKITYADALGNKAKLQDNDFSILVANPPYAVKGFLQTLSEAERKSYSLITTLNEKSWANNDTIETFFIERAKQLLKPGAVAGIVLPVSIISKEQLIYIANREIILKYFNIVSIVEFGNKTFGKTGTNTVTLFLRRKEEHPAPADHWKNRVDAWFTDNEADAVYNDSTYINNYCNHIEVDATKYKTLLIGKPSDELLKTEIFLDYKKAFDNLTETKNLQKQKTFKDKTKTDKEIELNKRFIAYIQTIERDKLYFYVLASENNSKVLVVKCPTENKEQKQFLGYDWSEAKGSEGIKYINQKSVYDDIDDEETKEMLAKISGLHNINTPLYNPNNRNDSNKINHYIQENFLSNELAITEDLKPYIAYYQTADLLDFTRKDFNKQINLSPNKLSLIQSKWSLTKLEKIVTLKGGDGFKEDLQGGKVITDIPFLKVSDMNLPVNKREIKVANNYVPKNVFEKQIKGTIFPINTIIFPKVGKAIDTNKKRILSIPCAVDNNVMGMTVKDEKELLPLFIFNYFELFVDLREIASNANPPSISAENAYQFKIPLPSLSIQQQIVNECNDIDKEVEKANEEIEKAKDKIEKYILDVFSQNYRQEKISKFSIVNPSKTEIKNIDNETIVSFVEMASVSENGIIATKVDKSLKDLRKGSYTYFRDSDIIIAKITPCMENGKCAIAKDLSNGIGMGSSEFHVIRTNETMNNKFLFTILNREIVRKEAEKNMTGSSGHRRVPASYYENFKVPVPPIKEQEIIVKRIEKLEQTIIAEQSKIDSAADKKKEILRRNL